MKRFILLSAFIGISFITGCQKNISEPITESETIISETEETETEIILSPDVQTIIDAIEAASNQPSFQLNTSAVFHLNGSSINGTYHLQSEIHILQEANHKNLQMTSTSSSDIDDIITNAWYQDGWYYSDNGTEKEKLEKSPDEVLSKVTEVSGLVLDAADKIENVNIKKEGNTTIYTYQIPLYLIEKYINQVTSGPTVKDTPLAGTEITISDMLLSSIVTDDGRLTHQELQLTGSIHKAIFTVPSTVTISADFTETDDTTLPMELW